jgi:hypothetical protein
LNSTDVNVDVTGTDNYTVSPQASNVTYFLTATNANGTVQQNLTIYTYPVPPSLPVILSFATNNDTVREGYSTQLDWVTLSATNLMLNGTGLNVNVTGEIAYNVTPPANNTVYTLTASNENGTVNANKTIYTYIFYVLPTIYSLNASNDTIMRGDITQLNWVVGNVTSLILNSTDTNVVVTGQTAYNVTPLVNNTVYRLTASNENGSVNTTKTIVFYTIFDGLVESGTYNLYNKSYSVSNQKFENVTLINGNLTLLSGNFTGNINFTNMSFSSTTSVFSHKPYVTNSIISSTVNQINYYYDRAIYGDVYPMVNSTTVSAPIYLIYNITGAQTNANCDYTISSLAKYGSMTPSALTCTGNVTNITYYTAAGNYFTNYSIYDEFGAVQGNGTFVVNELFAPYVSGTSVYLAGYAGQANISSSPVTITNLGNRNVTSVNVTSRNLLGVDNTSLVLASWFYAGKTLLTSSNLVVNQGVPVSFSVSNGPSSSQSLYLWLSLPSNISRQIYISPTPWILEVK